jgi:hypothetical protein
VDLNPASPRITLKAIYAYDKLKHTVAEIASQYDMVVLQNWTAPNAPDIKALNPKIKILFYRAAHLTWTWQENYGEINAHESWFLHDPATGRRAQSRSDGGYFLMDISNPDFRAYQIQYVMGWINRYGFDGMFWDGPPGAITRWISLDPPPDASIVSHWHQDVLTFLREMKQALGSKLLITNSTPIYDSGVAGVDDSDYLTYVDGTMLEGFAHAPWDAYTTKPGGAWNWQQRMGQRNMDAGKYLNVISGLQLQGAPADQVKRWQTFTLASYLLVADGQRAYYTWGPYGTDEQSPIFPEMNVPLGTPRGAAYQRDGVWQRDFAKGKVVVNPSDNSQSVTLPAGLHTLDMSVATQTTPR